MFSLPWISLTAAHIPCNDPMWCPHIAFNRDIWSCALWSYTFHLHSQKMLWLCGGQSTYTVYAPKLDWLNGWFKLYFNLRSFANLADITNNVNVRYLRNIHVCIQIFDNWMDCFECDGLHDEKWLRSCEEFDSLSKNQFWSTIHMQLVVVQTADNCTYCLHTCAKAFAICSNH